MAKRLTVKDWADNIVMEVEEKENRYYNGYDRDDRYEYEEEDYKQIRNGGYSLYHAFGF